MMITLNSLKKAKDILGEEWNYYYKGRIYEAQYFKQENVVEALKEFDEKGKCKENIITGKYVLTRNFLKKVRAVVGTEHFWKYIGWRIKETEENNDFRNYILILTNCKPDVKLLYKKLELESVGDNLFKEYKRVLKRLKLQDESLCNVSKIFETFDFT